MKVKLFYGTETGNAELLCDDFEAELGDDYECEIAALDEVSPSELEPDAFHLFVTSTFGNGDLPSNAQVFADALEAQKPDLSAIRFAIFGLGDMVFDTTFAQGSEKLAELLVAHKAQMVGERGIHDASSGDMPEDVGLPWLRALLPSIPALAA